MSVVKPLFLVGVKVIIENTEGKILVLNRSEKTGSGWSLPGGGLDEGEDVMTAVIREVSEETTIIISNPQVFSVKTHIKEKENSAIVLGFVAKYKEGEVHLNWEHTEFNWITPEEALSLELTPDAKYFIESFIEYKNI